MTRSAMEVMDGLARDGTSLAVATVGGLFIAEQIGNAMLRNDEQRAEEDRVRQPLGFGCYLSTEGSIIRGEIENNTISFQYRGVRMSAKRQDILSIHRSGEKPTCTVELADGCRFTDVWLLSNLVIQTAAGDINIDGSTASKWRKLYGISFGERRLVEAERQKQRRAEMSRFAAEQAARRRPQPPDEQRQRELQVEVKAFLARKARRERLVTITQGVVGLTCLCAAGLLLAWSQLHL